MDMGLEPEFIERAREGMPAGVWKASYWYPIGGWDEAGWAPYLEGVDVNPLLYCAGRPPIKGS